MIMLSAAKAFTRVEDVEQLCVHHFTTKHLQNKRSYWSISDICNQHKENDATGALLLAKTLFKRSFLQVGPVCSLKRFPSITGDLVAIRQI